MDKGHNGGQLNFRKLNVSVQCIPLFRLGRVLTTAEKMIGSKKNFSKFICVQLFKRYRKPTRRDRIKVWVISFKNIHAIIKHEVFPREFLVFLDLLS